MGKRVLTAYERAVERGKIEGKLEGKLEKAIETARQMLEEGFHLEQILRITGLSQEELEKNGLV
jgi:predicted transposase/invertase (TIGR01784 family)